MIFVSLPALLCYLQYSNVSLQQAPTPQQMQARRVQFGQFVRTNLATDARLRAQYQCIADNFGKRFGCHPHLDRIWSCVVFLLRGRTQSNYDIGFWEDLMQLYADGFEITESIDCKNKAYWFHVVNPCKPSLSQQIQRKAPVQLKHLSATRSGLALPPVATKKAKKTMQPLVRKG